MRALVVLVLCAFLAQSEAAVWWFGSDSEDSEVDEDAVVEAAEEISQECLNLAAWGQCAFYDCVERRFPCGPEGYNQKISKHFCTKIDENFNTFDAFGKRWLNQTSICLVGHMLTIYRDQETATCGQIKAAGIEGVLNCNEGIVDGHNFCHFLNTNGDAYKALMGSREVSLLVSLGDRRVFQSMITNTISCSVENFREFATSATRRFMDMVGSLWGRIWGN